MTISSLAPPVIARRPGWLAIVTLLMALVWSTNTSAQAPVATAGAAFAPSDAELAALVDRIALYPDDLIAIILPAATNPLQLVQADRYLDKRKTDPRLPVDEQWDDAVKSLLNYPDVVKSMSVNLDWTAALGEAVVADQGAVLEAIQTFRRQTYAAGNLKSDAKQVVVIEKEIINIVPANPQVIYVPQYNPSTVVVVGGYSSWGYYPTPYPVYYYPYPPGAAFATGLIWGAAISSAWNGGHYVAHYGGHGGSANINVNRNINRNTTNINTGNINTGNINRAGRPSQLPAGTTQWKSNKQPGQVSGAVGGAASQRVGYAAPAGGARSAAAARPSTQPVGSGAGHGSTSRSSASSNLTPARASASTTAFSGYESGRQTQMDSSRGAASRGAMSSAQPHHMSGGGGGSVGRSGGGGGHGGRR